LTTDTVIRAESLAKIYRSGASELRVFEHLSLEVRAGERLAIIGESGSGKSTLLHLLGGLDRPSSGTIYFGTQNIGAFTDRQLAEFRNRELGFVWQNPSLLPEFTSLENVMMPLLIRGLDVKEASAAARSRLDEVGLGARETHRAGELSGGEQQRIALARALVGNPRFLMADEATGNLDHRTGEMIAGLLSELHATHGLTSIFVTHNLGFAEQCDRVLQLDKGSLFTPADLELQPAGIVRDATRLDGGNYV